ncbi:ABC transporter permease [Vineibacter terrae]|uniref:MlaE family ABC transporter permease n=1 Tax=Vineibacter terrae TaxID=2586908 RepID=UPI002E34D210|nr:ABC transporter permease [Vineibacter terrae]HEX2888290.1 ABC transporter permease [Vineibacter terrae]
MTDIASDAAETWLRPVDRAGRVVLEAGGTWTVFAVAELRHLEDPAKGRRNVAAIDIAGIHKLDTAGALEIVRLQKLFPDADVEGGTPEHLALIELVTKGIAAGVVKPQRMGWLAHWLYELGETVMEFFEQTARLLAFFGEVLVVLAGAIRRPRRFRMSSVVAQMHEVWILAMPIVGVLTFLIGVVVAYQGVEQLKAFGAETFTVEAVSISVLRELGVLLTAIIVAGRSGSAFTAQIGTMQVNLELDAMRTMALNPIEWLVVPRIIALTLSMPLLVFFGNMMGLLGGALACMIYLDFTLVQFFDRLRDTVYIWHFWTGMIKAPVFAFVIAAVGCYEGLQVKGSADSVGRQTTKSVVEAIFFVVVLDALFSIIFLVAGV